jgi:hypothetical protein
MLHVNIDLSESLQDCVEGNIYQAASLCSRPRHLAELVAQPVTTGTGSH